MVDAYGRPVPVGAFVYAFPAGFVNPTIFRVCEVNEDGYFVLETETSERVKVFGVDTVLLPNLPLNFWATPINQDRVSDIVGNPVGVDGNIVFYSTPGGTINSGHIVGLNRNFYNVVLTNGKQVTVDVRFTVRTGYGRNPNQPLPPVDMFNDPINIGDPIVYLSGEVAGGNFGVVVDIRENVVDVVPAGSQYGENPHAVPIMLQKSIVLPGRVTDKIPTLRERLYFKQDFINLDATGTPVNIGEDVLCLRGKTWGTGRVVGFTAAKVRVLEEGQHRPTLKFGYELVGNIPNFNHYTMSFSKTDK